MEGSKRHILGNKLMFKNLTRIAVMTKVLLAIGSVVPPFSAFFSTRARSRWSSLFQEPTFA